MYGKKLSEDEAFVEIFQKEHNEQFYVLVKMHLSFLLHMTTEESDCFYEKVKLKKWNVPFGKKSKRNLTEGIPLSEGHLRQTDQIIQYLMIEDNLKSDGIFRRTGSIERQHDLKNLLSQGKSIDFKNTNFNVHDCASVLKSFLAELPEPLLTDAHYPVYCQIGTDVTQESKLLQAVQLLLLLLPRENKELLRNILELLHKVTLYENDNRMSAENLAKLFTPHLLCPRKIAPETLLKDSQILFGIVSFMIKKFPAVFEIPSQLMLDFRTHHEQSSVLNESVKGAAHTVFTFVDNKLTAKENEENPTETALAQLYAHIQSLPESSKKRKLVKQFNKENGQGTPLQVVRSSMPKNKSIGDSIKKHMFHRKLMRNVKRSSHLKKSSSEEVLGSPHSANKTPSTRRLFCHNFDSSPEDDSKIKRNGDSSGSRDLRRSKSDSNLSDNLSSSEAQYLTSTPACLPLRGCHGDEVFTPKGEDRDSMSPITRSTQRMPRAMQETMMTPRSRKPVLLISGTNINGLANVEPRPIQMQGVTEETYDNRENSPKITSPPEKIPRLNRTEPTAGSLTKTFRDYLGSRDMLTLSTPVDSSFSTCTDDFNSSDFSDGKMSDSMAHVMNGNDPESDGEGCEKELVLKPMQFDEDGKPIMFETSF